MKALYKVIVAISDSLNLVFIAVGVIYIIYIGPEKLFNDPVYTMLVIIFYFLISKKFYKD